MRAGIWEWLSAINELSQSFLSRVLEFQDKEPNRAETASPECNRGYAKLCNDGPSRVRYALSGMIEATGHQICQEKSVAAVI